MTCPMGQGFRWVPSRQSIMVHDEPGASNILIRVVLAYLNLKRHLNLLDAVFFCGVLDPTS
jgi:uncharacterized membrane protein YpjA